MISSLSGIAVSKSICSCVRVVFMKVFIQIQWVNSDKKPLVVITEEVPTESACLKLRPGSNCMVKLKLVYTLLESRLVTVIKLDPIKMKRVSVLTL